MTSVRMGEKNLGIACTVVAPIQVGSVAVAHAHGSERTYACNCDGKGASGDRGHNNKEVGCVSLLTP